MDGFLPKRRCRASGRVRTLELLDRIPFPMSQMPGPLELRPDPITRSMRGMVAALAPLKRFDAHGAPWSRPLDGVAWMSVPGVALPRPRSPPAAATVTMLVDTSAIA